MVADDQMLDANEMAKVKVPKTRFDQSRRHQ